MGSPKNDGLGDRRKSEHLSSGRTAYSTMYTHVPQTISLAKKDPSMAWGGEEVRAPRGGHEWCAVAKMSRVSLRGGKRG